MTEDDSALSEFAPGLWLADGPVVDGALGFRFPTRMAVLGLPDGGVLVWSPVALTPDLRRSVDAVGPVRQVIAPNGLHHMFVADWAAAYPQADVIVAPGVQNQVPGLRVTADLRQAYPAGWEGVLDCVLIETKIMTEAVLFHRHSGTVLFTDLLQQHPPGWFRGWRGLVARLDGMVGVEPAVPRKFRVALRDRAAARNAVRQILNWRTKRVVMAHGAPVTHDAPTFLARAFLWLRP
ncbi:DUF4336 domain-containing protein [Marivivens marinus]|uniref:DUF4336 domain-containing protein n=1 Tax=Marivivens marinus TaxID=3110173 RepID=UPI003B847D12